MFKSASCDTELMQAMEKSLAAKELEDTHQFNKIAKAIEYLSAAADIFDQANMSEEAAELTEILESLAK